MADRSPAPAPPEMEDMTPRAVNAPGVSTVDDSRYNVVRDAATAKDKKALVYLAYEGRKGRLFPGEDDEDDDDETVGVQAVPEEHIDVIVPNKRNKRLAAAYLDAGAPGGRLTDTQLDDLKKGGISHESIQVSGKDYHFVTHQPTPVQPQHVAWLTAHPTYRFVERTD